MPIARITTVDNAFELGKNAVPEFLLVSRGRLGIRDLAAGQLIIRIIRLPELFLAYELGHVQLPCCPKIPRERLIGNPGVAS